mgnify:CR=1 FL=1
MVKSLEYWDFHKIMSWIGGCRRCARPRGALLLQFDAYYEKQAYNKTAQTLLYCTCTLHYITILYVHVLGIL